MITVVKKKYIDETGQALFEFIFFVPFIAILLILLMGIGNSINGAINQQKVTRAYFYARLSNNSMMPEVDGDFHLSLNSFGMDFTGWAKELEGRAPVQPCYELKTPIEGANPEQECEAYEGTSTKFIRVGTVYGVCGATYVKSDSNQIFRAPAPGPGVENIVAQASGCLLK